MNPEAIVRAQDRAATQAARKGVKDLAHRLRAEGRKVPAEVLFDFIAELDAAKARIVDLLAEREVLKGSLAARLRDFETERSRRWAAESELADIKREMGRPDPGPLNPHDFL